VTHDHEDERATWTVVWYRTGGELCEDRYECQAVFDYEECDTEEEVIECLARLEYEHHPAVHPDEWKKVGEDFYYMVFDGAPLQEGIQTDTLDLVHIQGYATLRAKERVAKLEAERDAKRKQEEERLQKEKERKDRFLADRKERSERTALSNLLAKYGVPDDYVQD
jgi:hypothetical protein